MSFEKKIEILTNLAQTLQSSPEGLEVAIRKAKQQNQWFTADNVKLSVDAIIHHFLAENQLRKWLSNYSFNSTKKTIGIIAAGNIPLVGFHDVLCCFVCNFPIKVKLSSKDTPLMEYMIELLQEADKSWKAEIVERLHEFDAVIATGSNNTHRFFEQYFSKVPSLLRKHRNSIAVIDGSETKEELTALADDIFQYFGMGCRNVTKLMLPQGYQPESIYQYFEKYDHLADHKLYKDNFDYNCTLLLMNQTKHLANYFAILKEDESLYSRLATIHYSFYHSEEELKKYLIENNQQIQCIVGHPSPHYTSVPFGKAQQPELWDYADNVDTLNFLLSL
jgi:hypothetical protein